MYHVCMYTYEYVTFVYIFLCACACMSVHIHVYIHTYVIVHYLSENFSLSRNHTSISWTEWTRRIHIAFRCRLSSVYHHHSHCHHQASLYIKRVVVLESSNRQVCTLSSFSYCFWNASTCQFVIEGNNGSI